MDLFGLRARGRVRELEKKFRVVDAMNMRLLGELVSAAEAMDNAAGAVVSVSRLQVVGSVSLPGLRVAMTTIGAGVAAVKRAVDVGANQGKVLRGEWPVVEAFNRGIATENAEIAKRD